MSQSCQNQAQNACWAALRGTQGWMVPGSPTYSLSHFGFPLFSFFAPMPGTFLLPLLCAPSAPQVPAGGSWCVGRFLPVPAGGAGRSPSRAQLTALSRSLPAAPYLLPHFGALSPSPAISCGPQLCSGCGCWPGGLWGCPCPLAARCVLREQPSSHAGRVGVPESFGEANRSFSAAETLDAVPSLAVQLKVHRD